MKAPFITLATFLCIMVIGIALFATIDAFVLGSVDGKLAHDSQGQFMLVFGFGMFLTAGSVIPVAIAAFILRRFVGRSPILFALMASIWALGFFVSQAYVPLAAWLEPIMPRPVLRSVLNPIFVSIVIGVVSTIFASIVCFDRNGKHNA